MNDDHIYLKVTEEVSNGKIDPALWAKAIAKALGDEDKGKYEYINLRVEQLKESNIDSQQQDTDERFMPPGTSPPNDDAGSDDFTEPFIVEEENQSDRASMDTDMTSEQGTFFKNLIKGHYGLAKTYWGYAIGVGFLLYILSFAIGSAGSPTLSIIWIIGLYSYQVIVWIGVWRAAGLYKGPTIWSALAKFAVIIGVLMAIGLLAPLFSATY